MSDADPQREPDPEFGPGGYLPQRAARRARKIVLRAPLGVQWIVASLVAGVVVLVAGLLLLTKGSEPPGAPFVAVAPFEDVAPALELEDPPVLLVAVGRVRAFPSDTDGGLGWCSTSGRVESRGGGVWSPTGRALHGGESLASHPTVVHDGTVYVDPTRFEDGPPPATGDQATPTCVP